MQINSFPALVVTAFAAAAAPGVAQHAGHAAHQQAAPRSVLPTEPGDSVFAAVSEIVSLLMADPNTEWSRVDIAALRAHLTDMNRLMLDARVQSEPLETGVRMRISLDGPGGGAAHRMVPAHGPVLEAETGWSSDLSIGRNEIVWTVTADDDTEAMRIAALGFFGLMAMGDHHRAHHLALARGETTH